MHARFASGVCLALGFADVAWLDLHLAPQLAAEVEKRDVVAAPAELSVTNPTAVAPKAPEPKAPEPKASPPKAPAPTPVVAADPRPASAVPDVLFALESDRVTSVAAALALQRVANELRAHAGRSLLVRGHADRLGLPAHNLALSRQRAESVRQILIMQGAPGGRITVEAVGDAEPADSDDTPTAWAKNRRVQLLWR